MKASRKRQRGLALSGLILLGIVVVLVAIAGIRILPSIIEYYTIVEDATAVARDPASKTATVADIRKAFDRHAEIDDVSSIRGRDLDVSKEGNEIVLSFAYTKKIPLTARVSLLIDFEGSTAGSAKQ